MGLEEAEATHSVLVCYIKPFIQDFLDIRYIDTRVRAVFLESMTASRRFRIRFLFWLRTVFTDFVLLAFLHFNDSVLSITPSATLTVIACTDESDYDGNCPYYNGNQDCAI